MITTHELASYNLQAEQLESSLREAERQWLQM